MVAYVATWLDVPPMDIPVAHTIAKLCELLRAAVEVPHRRRTASKKSLVRVGLKQACKGLLWASQAAVQIQSAVRGKTARCEAASKR
eukprot:4138609-Amphidinium_carterae.2